MMKKQFARLAALALALTLALPTLTLAASAKTAARFSDVPASHWAAESIERCASLGILNGVGGGAFGLGTEMTRAAYALALCRLFGWELISPAQGSFADNQDSSAWYYSAIETAYAHGVLTDESSLCRPDEPVTREEVAKLTVRALGYTTLAGLLAEAGECPFADCTTSQGYITLAYRMGILKGVSRWSFDPKSNATREQAAAVLLRLYDRLHATLTVTELASGEDAPTDCVAVAVRTSAVGESAVNPRAALEEVYAAAIAAGEGGSVLLTCTPVAQTTRGGVATDEAAPLSAEALSALLADGKSTVYRSARYGSTRVTHTERGTTATVVWYETEADIAEKLTLCRLLGLGTAYVVR